MNLLVYFVHFACNFPIFLVKYHHETKFDIQEGIL